MSALTDDVLAPVKGPRANTVAGLLATLDLERASVETQRAVLHRTLSTPGLRQLIEALRPELEAAGLL